MVNLGELVFSIIAEDKASTTVGAAAAKIGQSMAVAGAAITAFGGAATLLIDRNREMDASFKTTALSAGLPAESIKELARELQSVDEPIANVSRTLDLLARSGMDNAETMEGTAAAFDLLGDAIGATGDEVATAMVPAFKSLNVPLEEAPQHVDALTVAFREANIDLDGFADVMGEQGPALGKMGVSLEEAAAMMMIFAENGVVGENVSEQLNEALNNCDGSTTKLYKSLGMSKARSPSTRQSSRTRRGPRRSSRTPKTAPSVRLTNSGSSSTNSARRRATCSRRSRALPRRASLSGRP